MVLVMKSLSGLIERDADKEYPYSFSIRMQRDVSVVDSTRNLAITGHSMLPWHAIRRPMVTVACYRARMKMGNNNLHSS